MALFIFVEVSVVPRNRLRNRLPDWTPARDLSQQKNGMHVYRGSAACNEEHGNGGADCRFFAMQHDLPGLPRSQARHIVGYAGAVRRFNLYAAVALAKIKGGWLGSPEQLAAVQDLTKSGNYLKDATFKTWVDAALKNYRKSGLAPEGD